MWKALVEIRMQEIINNMFDSCNIINEKYFMSKT